MYSRCCSIYCH